MSSGHVHTVVAEMGSPSIAHDEKRAAGGGATEGSGRVPTAAPNVTVFAAISPPPKNESAYWLACQWA